MSKSPYLNGGYYGPPIPPPRSSKHSGGDRGCCARCGCCLVDLLCNCGCCLLGCVFKIIFSILIAVGLVLLLLWFLIRPHTLRFEATSASLTEFNYSSANHQLSYDLTLNLTVRNPNRHLGVYYDVIRVNPAYEGFRFSTAEVEPFYQRTNNVTELGPVVFRGRKNAVVLGVEQNGDYQNQKSNGEFKFDVKLDLQVRFKLGLIKTTKVKPKIKCKLNVPLSDNHGMPVVAGKKFESANCDYYLW